MKTYIPSTMLSEIPQRNPGNSEGTKEMVKTRNVRTQNQDQQPQRLLTIRGPSFLETLRH